MIKRSDIGIGLLYRRSDKTRHRKDKNAPPKNEPDVNVSTRSKSSDRISSGEGRNTPKQESMLQVIPVKKYDGEGSPHLFTYTAKKSGVFCIHLDNMDSPMLGMLLLG
jgi:hypothetical protein